MRAKKKRVLLVITLLLILAAVVVAMFQFTQSGYLTTVPYRSAFTEIASHVYINRNYAGDQQELFEMIEQAKDRVRTFFGDVRFQDETIFIICDDDKLTRKLGEDHGTVILYFPSETYYICISDEYLELDILAHEITHAELHTRLSAEAQKRIPTWFDEGIALQNDYREKYSEAQWITQTDNGKNAVALEDMDTPSEFYAGEAEDRRFRYLNAKHELDVWMISHGQQSRFQYCIWKLISSLTGYPYPFTLHPLCRLHPPKRECTPLSRFLSKRSTFSNNNDSAFHGRVIIVRVRGVESSSHSPVGCA